MDLNKNYYAILNLKKDCSEKDIKKAYHKLSFEYHPDKNKDSDPKIFNEINEAYNILYTDKRDEYDKKSRFGSNYNEYYELLDVDFNLDFDDVKSKLETFKKNEINNIYITVGDDFNGNLEYERWIRCKTCDGSGKDMSSKIIIRDSNGNITKIFDSDDGCDFCDGTGVDMYDKPCSFCNGNGKVGLTPCNSCKGERRIYGKQKLKGVKLTGDETKIESMGHQSKEVNGKVGSLIIRKG